MPIVRNIKYSNKRDHNVYIGRTIYNHYGEVLRKGSPLNNPIRMEPKSTDAEREAERDRVIAEYGIWLRDKVKAGDPRVWSALRSITEASVLMCECYPRKCHGSKVVQMWTYLKNKGLIEPLHTNHTDKSTLENVARANAKEVTPAHTALGPLPMDQITAALIDARLDEQILESHAVACDCAPAPVNALQRSLPPKKKQGIGAPRKPRGIVYIKADVRYNRIDDIAADLAELYTTSEYVAATRDSVPETETREYTTLIALAS
jgi:hypothetical protein